ncbi:MAG: hypothetical protein ORN51_10630 [Akkermansiaceae bacterium]|nr:hypothetical protein [Akkermansiaceae bacterium]
MDEFIVLEETNTLVVSGMEPIYRDYFSESNAEEFGLKNEDFSTPESILAASIGCQPLHDILECAYLDHRETLQNEADSLKDSQEPANRAKHIELNTKLKNLPPQCDKGLAQWITQLNEKQFDLLQAEATEWSRRPPGNDEEDGQEAALNYFRDLDSDICELLGVSIIEGDHPGSSYFAAELDKSIEDANKIAIEHGIQIRFCR